jgi:hypothetical protein
MSRGINISCEEIMDLRIREFLDQIINLVNLYDDIPLEARRLALESAMYNTERAANKAIKEQNEKMLLEANNNAENLSSNKLGELPFGKHAVERIESEPDGLRS